MTKISKTDKATSSNVFLRLLLLFRFLSLFVLPSSTADILATINAEESEAYHRITDEINEIELTDIYDVEKERYNKAFSFSHSTSEECQPRHIHLSPGDSVVTSNNGDGTISKSLSSLTISFSLPFDIPRCHPSTSIPSVVYGLVLPYKKEGSSKDERGGEEERRVYPSEIDDDVRQYNITSAGMNDELYNSDWIYHLHITGLKSGGVHYWYRIEVEERKGTSSTMEMTQDNDSEDSDEDNAVGGPIEANVTSLENDLSVAPGSDNSSTSTVSLRKRSNFSLVSVRGRSHLRHSYGITKEETEETDSILKLLATENETNSFRSNSVDGARKIVASSLNLTFRTPPSPGSLEPIRIAMVGDLGQTENSSLTVSHMLSCANYSSRSVPISLILIAGDLSYANSDQTRWPTWFDLIEPLVRHTPLAVAAGNHEEEYDEATNQKFTAYENWFRMPNRIGRDVLHSYGDMEKQENDSLVKWWGGWSWWGWWGWWWPDWSAITRWFQPYKYDYGNSYYAFTHGMVRIITLNTYTDSSRGSKQYRWLQSELKALDRSVTPWVIVMFHAPLYTSFNSHIREKDSNRMRKAMEHLFVDYRVNLIVCGHDHAYMRTHSMFFGSRDSSGKAPVYVTVGAGGNQEKLVKGYLHTEPESWVAARDRFDYGYGELKVLNATSAQWRWVRDGTITEGIRDHAWLTNQYFL